jgi:hypothetical protein
MQNLDARCLRASHLVFAVLVFASSAVLVFAGSAVPGCAVRGPWCWPPQPRNF